MLNGFTLTRKTNLDAGPVSLAEIDDELCAALGFVRDKDKYHLQWADTIGQALACGQSFDTIIRHCKEAIEEAPGNYFETKLQIVKYLNNNYNCCDAWAEE